MSAEPGGHTACYISTSEINTESDKKQTTDNKL